jgi:hypothetical protein
MDRFGFKVLMTVTLSMHTKRCGNAPQTRAVLLDLRSGGARRTFVADVANATQGLRDEAVCAAVTQGGIRHRTLPTRWELCLLPSLSLSAAPTFLPGVGFVVITPFPLSDVFTHICTVSARPERGNSIIIVAQCTTQLISRVRLRRSRPRPRPHATQI